MKGKQQSENFKGLHEMGKHIIASPQKASSSRMAILHTLPNRKEWDQLSKMFSKDRLQEVFKIEDIEETKLNQRPNGKHHQ